MVQMILLKVRKKESDRLCRLVLYSLCGAKTNHIYF